ncbi:MAG: glucokinase [Hyphomicrobiales bacterium]
MTFALSAIDTLPYPVLVADIGGTNARFGILTDSNAELDELENAKTADFDGLEDAIAAMVTSKTHAIPRSAVLAIAGPISGDEVPLTNCDWVIRPRNLMRTLDLEDVILVNDFEAQSLALPSLCEGDLKLIGDVGMPQTGTKVVVGPGTGLGAAGMVHAGNIWVPVPGEGGHIDLGPITDEEFDLWPHFEKEHGRISAEALLCGRGLVRLYNGVCSWRNIQPEFSTPSEITSAALSSKSGCAHEALKIFCRLLGRVAGNLALAFMAKGGVYLAGGISQKIADFLANSEFREAFISKAPHEELMSEMSTAVITHEKPALMGLAAFARAPQVFGVDVDGRRWQK